MTKVGTGEFSYSVVEGWAKPPLGWTLNDVSGMAIDSNDHIYIFNRSEHPMMIFDVEGNFLDSWGEGLFSLPHHVRIGPDGNAYCVDYGDHTVRKITLDGNLLLTLGIKNQPSDTGVVGTDHRTIKNSSGPFNCPTDIAFGPSEELFVSDGYGNARIHRFSKDGALLSSWGAPGGNVGQFGVPHNVWIDQKDRLYVNDRENSRVQIFTLDGGFINQWKGIWRPSCLHIDKDNLVYITELGYMSEVSYPDEEPPKGHGIHPRFTIRSLEGEIIVEWGNEDRFGPGNFFAPHTVTIDSKGDIYVGELSATCGKPGCHSIQKFLRD